MAISTNGAILTRVVGALYNQYMSNATYAEVKDKSAATVAGDFIASDFAGKTDAQLATTILKNLGLSSITGLDNWVAAQLTAAGSTAAAKGAKLVSMLNDYANMTSDATYGSYATAFNARTDASLVKSQTAGAAGGDFTTSNVAPVSSGTFTLTTGNDVADANSAFRGSLVDSFRFTSGNETVSAGISTLGGGDIFIDSSTSDTDVLNATLNGSSGTFTAQNIETINANMAAGSAQLNMTNVIGTKSVSASGNVAGLISNFNAAATTPVFASTSYTNALSLRPDTLAGTSTTAETVNVEVSGASYGTTASTRSVITIDGTGGAGQLETLNITSNGTANVYQLNTSNAATLGTVNLLGAADTTVRVSHSDITGVTVAGGLNTGNTVLRIDRNGNTTTPTAAQNFSGLDKIQVVDSSGVDDDLSLTSVSTGSVIEALSGFNASTITVTGSAARTTDSLTVNLDHATANTSVALGALNVQDVETLNLLSTGNSSALVAAGNTATINGDATTVTVTGDTSLNLTINVDAPSSGSRTTVVNASAITGTATVTLNASGDSNTANLYNLTGTANADTLSGTAVAANTISGGDGNDTITGGAANDTADLGNGDDRYTTTAGTDTITMGGGNDTIVIAASASNTTATAQVSTLLNLNTTVTLAASDGISVVINGTTYTTTFTTDAPTTVAAFATAHGNNIRATHGVTVASIDTDTDLRFTGDADGTAFTITSRIWDNSASAYVTQTVTASATGVVAGTGDNRIGDFSAATGNTDVFSLANLTLAAGGYYEGAVGGATAATDYTVMVITGASYADANAAQTAIAAQLTSGNNSDGIVVYLDSAVGYARMYYTDTIDGNSGENVIVDFTGITTLAGIAAAFSAGQFGL